VVLLGGLLLGGFVGAINGFFIAYEGIPAFIVTLATLAVVRGIALLVTQGYSIPVPADSLFTFRTRVGRGYPHARADRHYDSGYRAYRSQPYALWPLRDGYRRERRRRATQRD
jgi:hypothetical protein